MQRFILSFIVLLGISAVPYSISADPVTNHPTWHFTSITNFRDLAGPRPGYRTLDGHYMRSGLIFRSGNLSPNAQDLATLERLKITRVYDLRTIQEAEGKPDVAIPGAEYIPLDIVGHDLNDDYDKVPDAAFEHRWMEDFYRDFVRVPYQRAQFALAVKDILHAPGPIVYHCAAGKDRTGWLSVILLSALGVPSKTIADDFYLTNAYDHAGPFPAHASKLRQISWEGDDIADPDYYHAAFNEVHHLYGTMNNYIHKGLGLDIATLNALKAKFLY